MLRYARIMLNKLCKDRNNPLDNIEKYTAKLKDENGKEMQLPKCNIKDAKPQEIKK